MLFGAGTSLPSDTDVQVLLNRLRNKKKVEEKRTHLRFGALGKVAENSVLQWHGWVME